MRARGHDVPGRRFALCYTIGLGFASECNYVTLLRNRERKRQRRGEQETGYKECVVSAQPFIEREYESRVGSGGARE